MRSPLHYSTLHHKAGAKRAGGGPLVVTTHVQLLGAFFAPHKLTRTYAPKADLGSSSEVVKRTSVCSGMATEARRTAANEEKKRNKTFAFNNKIDNFCTGVPSLFARPNQTIRIG